MTVFFYFCLYLHKPVRRFNIHDIKILTNRKAIIIFYVIAVALIFFLNKLKINH